MSKENGRQESEEASQSLLHWTRADLMKTFKAAYEKGRQDERKKQQGDEPADEKPSR